MTMKRVDLVKTGGFQAGTNLVTSEVSVPMPQPHEVLIDVKASAINPVDWKQAEYHFLLPSEVSTTHPVALGCDVAGIVVGPSDSPLLGRNVVTYLGADKTTTKETRGAYVDRVCADSDLVFAFPDALSYAEATTLPVPALTAVLLLHGIEPVMKRGDFVAIWGTSSAVGHFALQVCQKAGYRTIAIASGKHEAAARALEATAFLDYRTESDIVQAVKDILKENDGTMRGAIDCIGTEDTFTKCAEMVADPNHETLVASVNYGGDGPGGVKRVPVDLGTATTPERRPFLHREFPKVFDLKPQKVRSVVGPVDAETVERAFQINKDGVSGEKVVIEWTK